MGKSYTLIITNKFDYCTDSIIKWLKFYNQSFIIIDTNKKVQITKILISNKEKRIELLIDNKNIELKQIDSVVFWKGRIHFDIPIVQLKNKNKDYKREVDRFLKRELETITNLIYDDLNKKKIFGLCITKNPNKLILLDLAKEVGLNIPETTISSVSKIIKDKVKGTVSITKPIQEIFNYREKDRAYATFT